MKEKDKELLIKMIEIEIEQLEQKIKYDYQKLNLLYQKCSNPAIATPEDCNGCRCAGFAMDGHRMCNLTKKAI